MIVNTNNPFDFDGKRVSVIGAARSGIAAARALLTLGARHVLLSDSKSIDELAADVLQQVDEIGVDFAASATPEMAIPKGTDLVVTSPGVPKYAAVLRHAVEAGVPVWSEIELAYRISPAAIIAITGTNGKTTTTLLAAGILRAGGLDAVVAGNISADEMKCTLVDAAFAAYLEGAVTRLIVAEISSFQLEWIAEFSPWISVLTNITPDHLNRHRDMDEYASAKRRIFERQSPTDWAITCSDDPISAALSLSDVKAQHLRVARKSGVLKEGADAYVDWESGDLTICLPKCEPEVIMNARDLPDTLPGSHSITNALMAAAIGRIAGVSPTTIATAVRSFRGAPHRMELAGECHGVRYINNSMCTNVAAAAASIESIGSPAIIIMGGADKEIAFDGLAEPLIRYAHHTILIGSAADKIEAAVRSRGYTRISRANTLEEAVLLGASMAKPGMVVSLTPACASFDMFTDFEARGAEFRRIVSDLQGQPVINTTGGRYE